MKGDVLITDARLVGVGPPGQRRGKDMARVEVIPRGDLLIRDGVIAGIEAVGANGSSSLRDATNPARTKHYPQRGQVIMPGFVDCHTHACWVGSRVDEWQEQMRGVPYLEILKRGGGIMSTVRAVRTASEKKLSETLALRLVESRQAGQSAIEVKSGYGLTTADELKMLRVIVTAKPERGMWSFPQVIPTALLGHAIDPEQSDFVRRTIEETVPAVHAEFPGIAIDAYCENGAWSREDCLRLFDRAMELGHPCRVHADQFTSLGMVSEAAKRGFVSVDHLEATTAPEIEALAASKTTAVLLPCSGFHLKGAYANGRALIDAGCAVALATNFNPGSAPCPSLPFAMALAVRHCGMTFAEAFNACTVNAAHVLGLADRGSLCVGSRGEVVSVDTSDERELAYGFGGQPRVTILPLEVDVHRFGI